MTVNTTKQYNININLGERKKNKPETETDLRSSPPPTYSVMQPQTTTASSAAHNSNNRASSPAGDRSITSASNGALRVPGVPAGRISSVARRTDSPCQSMRARRSTTCSASGRPWRSVAMTKDARVRVRGTTECVLRVRKTMSNDARRGLARTRRVPHSRRECSPGEGTMRMARVRSCARGRMERENVSCVREMGGGEV